MDKSAPSPHGETVVTAQCSNGHVLRLCTERRLVVGVKVLGKAGFVAIPGGARRCPVLVGKEQSRVPCSAHVQTLAELGIAPNAGS